MIYVKFLRESVADEDKNGHIFALGRKELGDGDGTEAAIEGLGGARATSHRRLPDLPDPLAGTGGSVRSSQDTTSELYAQVAIGAVLNSCKSILSHFNTMKGHHL